LFGVITAIKAKQGEKKSRITLKLTDKTDVVLRKVKIANYTSGSDTSSSIVTNLVKQALGLTATMDIETTSKTIKYSSTHKPISEHIKAISTPTYTGGNRNYVFYVDENDKFWWFNPADAVNSTLSSDINATDTTIPVTDGSGFPNRSGTVTIGNEVIFYTSVSGNNITVPSWGRGYAGTNATTHSSGDAIVQHMKIVSGFSSGGLGKVYNISASKSTDSTINMLIMRLGKDLIGQNITWYAYNTNTTTSKLRMKVVDWRWVSEDYYKRNIDAQNALNGAWTPGVTFTNSNMTLSSTSGFSANGNVRIGGSEIVEYASVSGANLVIANESKRGLYGRPTPNTWANATPVQEVTTLVAAGNSAIRSAIQSLGRDYADVWFVGQREKWKVSVELDGVYINPQDIISLTAKDIGLNNLPLRVKDLNHILSNTTWRTTLKLEEDEEKR